MIKCWYWEPIMDAPVEVTGEPKTVTIIMDGKPKIVSSAFIFPNEWEALEWQQEVCDQCLFNFGVQVFYTAGPNENPKQCIYGGPDMEGAGKHILVYGGHVFSGAPEHIYGVKT